MYTGIITAAALFASAGLAAPAPRAMSEQFDLSVTSVTTESSNLEYDHAPVSACHSGAAIEALCVYGSGGTTFTFNSTTESPIIPGQSSPGYLVFTLPSQPQPEPQELQFFKNETSNVNAGFFGLGNGPTKLAVSENKALGVVVGDTLQYTWYVCPQTNLGYQYSTVSYVAAGQEPSNPDCRRVSLERS